MGYFFELWKDKAAKGEGRAPSFISSARQTSSKWVIFSNYGRIRQRKERDGLRLLSGLPKV